MGGRMVKNKTNIETSVFIILVVLIFVAFGIGYSIAKQEDKSLNNKTNNIVIYEVLNDSFISETCMNFDCKELYNILINYKTNLRDKKLNQLI
jgi:hypothetical protein